MAEQTDEELLAELGITLEAPKKGKYSAEEERIIAGFEDIERFYEQHGRLPRHGEDLDIFERLYAVRLERIRELPGAKDLLADFDKHGILAMDPSLPSCAESLSDEALLAELGIDLADESNVHVLRHVTVPSERSEADEVAQRTACPDFERFKPIFESTQAGLAAGTLETVRFKENASIEKGDLFILEGVFAYVDHVDPLKDIGHGKVDGRLRVIFGNGTQSNLLYRSLQKALYKDETGRRVVEVELGGLFGHEFSESDVQTGTVYVLRSYSQNEIITQNRALVHKIGVTTGDVKGRIAGAKDDPTYLLADVEVVGEYKLSGINPKKLEQLLHKVFAPAQLNLTIEDRFGKPVHPKEWFLVPLSVIDEAIELIRKGTTGLAYDVAGARLKTN